MPRACSSGGNGLRAVGVIEVLEEDLGIPVLTANQVTMWSALRAAGVPLDWDLGAPARREFGLATG